jgi:hypothetical protein
MVEVNKISSPKCCHPLYFHYAEGEAIPVAGHGGPCSYETPRIPHFFDNRLTDGG